MLVRRLELVLLGRELHSADATQDASFDRNRVFNDLSRLAHQPATVVDVAHVAFKVYAVDGVIAFKSLRQLFAFFVVEVAEGEV